MHRKGVGVFPVRARLQLVVQMRAVGVAGMTKPTVVS